MIKPLALYSALLCGSSAVAQQVPARLDPMPWDGGRYPWNYQGTLERAPQPSRIAGNCPATQPQARVLIAGDSWAQYMWDDNAHNLIFDKFGHADKQAVSRSLGSNPGPGHSGPEYAVSGSEAREWVNTASFPWIANVVAELSAQPSIDLVVFSLGGNDILAGKSGGGWYKQMDLDVPGSEAALFARVLADNITITNAFLAVRPQLDVLVSSYEYPNFNVSSLWCWIYACPKRDDLSRDPTNARVTDSELNAMSLDVEALRIAWTNGNPRLYFDHGVGEMHHYYGDGQSAPGVLPRPGQQAPDYLPFPAGQPLRPTLRSNFRTNVGISADPIHLNPAGYLYKVGVHTETHLFGRFRGPVSLTLNSQGGANDGWTDGANSGTASIDIGDTGSSLIRGIVSIDTSTIPAGAEISAASLYLLQETRSGSNPFVTGSLGLPRLDVVSGSFGAAQVEVTDFDAPATVSDAGCFVGSANEQHYALRIDLTPAGLAAIQAGGLTQFRIAFSTVDAAVNRVQFSTGSAPPAGAAEAQEYVEYIDERQPDGSIITREQRGSVIAHRGLLEVLGSARPFLDVRYSEPLLRDGFESAP